MLTPLPTYHFLFFRALFCLTTLLFLYKFVLRVNPLDVELDTLPFILIRSVTVAIGTYLTTLAMMFTDVTKVIILYYSPFIPSVLGYVLIGERVTHRDILFFTTAFIGMIFIMNPFDNIKGISDVFGVMLAILGSTIFNCGLIAMRKIKHRINMWAVPFYVQIVALMAAPVLYTLTEMVKDLTKETPLVHITISGKIAKRGPEDLE
jgi:drug/metabolite transporter (DMT)-like permease